MSWRLLCPTVDLPSTWDDTWNIFSSVSEEQVETSQVRIKGATNKGETVVSVCPDEEKEVDEAFYRELKTASKSDTLVLNYPLYLLDVRVHSKAQAIQETSGKH